MQSAAGKHDQLTLETKMDMLKKESGAERTWKVRMMELLSDRAYHAV